MALVGAIVLTAATSERAPAAPPPPAPTIAPTVTSAPADPTASSTASFTYTHPQTGVTFQCSLDDAAFTACAARGIAYGGLRDGAHTFRVAARNGASALGPSATRRWTIDTTPLPAPVLTGTPDEVTTSTAATFVFAAGDGGIAVSLECTLDTTPTRACTTPLRYRSLALGRHCFEVRAVSGSGRRSEATPWCWWVIVDHGFSIVGDAVDRLYPGGSSPVDVRITNPFPFALKVLSVTMTVASTTSRAACSGTQNLQATRQLTVQPVIPAGATASLSGLGVPRANWPQVTMPNLATNQDACTLARFSLRYEGTATKP